VYIARIIKYVMLGLVVFTRQVFVGFNSLAKHKKTAWKFG
jgi:hypothetical protein